jgi:hypothetical protein
MPDLTEDIFAERRGTDRCTSELNTKRGYLNVDISTTSSTITRLTGNVKEDTANTAAGMLVEGNIDGNWGGSNTGGIYGPISGCTDGLTKPCASTDAVYEATLNR